FVRMPCIRPHAAGEVDRAEPERAGCRRGERRHHGVQEGQCDRRSQGATQERAAGKMLLGNEHIYSFFNPATLFGCAVLAPALVSFSLSAGVLPTSAGSSLVRIWNGALSTIPMTIEDSR